MLKIDRTKFFQCPLQVITGRTWRMIEIVGETTNIDGGVTHRPYPGAYLQQPVWYREAVRMLRNEKTSGWFSELMKKKAESKRGK